MALSMPSLKQPRASKLGVLVTAELLLKQTEHFRGLYRSECSASFSYSVTFNFLQLTNPKFDRVRRRDENGEHNAEVSINPFLRGDCRRVIFVKRAHHFYALRFKSEKGTMVETQ